MAKGKFVYRCELCMFTATSKPRERYFAFSDRMYAEHAVKHVAFNVQGRTPNKLKNATDLNIHLKG